MLRKLVHKLILALSLVLTFNFATTALAAPAQNTVEGEGTHFVTGESFPSKLQVSGYNSRDNKLYLNIDLTTTKSVIGKTPTFNYYIDVFDNNGVLLGNAGNTTIPESKIGTSGVSTESVLNKEVILSSSLTAAYQAVVTVDHVELN